MTARRQALIIAVALLMIALCLSFGGMVPPALAQAISVTAADPPSGEQGTLNLDVVVGGKNFKAGANAKFSKTGTTDPAGVTVKATRYVSSTQLVATIDIADTAAVAGFDIQVTNTDGRTGKGTGLFKVTAKQDVPVYVAEFIEAKADDPAWSPKIRGDGAGAYPLGLREGYTFYLTAGVTTNRGVVFQFDNPYPVYPSNLACRQWGTGTPYNRAAGYPPHTLSADKIVVPYQAQFSAGYELTYDDALQKWVPIVDGVSRRGLPIYHLFDILGMAPGQKSYAGLVITLRFEGTDDVIWVNFNDTFMRNLLPTPSGNGAQNGGIVEVERSAAAEIWYIRPISSRFPVLGDPPVMIPQYQANQALYDIPDLKGEPGGNCDLGNFLMPFEIKVWRVR